MYKDFCCFKVLICFQKCDLRNFNLLVGHEFLGCDMILIKKMAIPVVVGYHEQKEALTVKLSMS